eukprot:Pgem_evm1s5880
MGDKINLPLESALFNFRIVPAEKTWLAMNHQRETVFVSLVFYNFPAYIAYSNSVYSTYE